MWIFSFVIHSFFFIFGISRYVDAIKCYKDVKVHCSNETSMLDRTVQSPQKLASEWCKIWCKQKNVVSYEVANNVSGRLKFRFQIPPKCQGVKYTLELINKDIGAILNEPLNLCLKPDCKKNYEKVFELEVDNIITTVHEMKINTYIYIQYDAYFPCSLEFGNFSFKRQKKELVITNLSNGSDLIITAKGGCIGFVDDIILKIFDSYCTKEIADAPDSYGKMNATFMPTIEDGYHCSAYNEKDTCYCRKSSEEIKCTFSNTPEGNYCADILMPDNQCKKSRQLNFTFKPSVTDSIVNVSIPTKAGVISVMTCTIILLLFLTGIIIFYKRKHVSNIYTTLPLLQFKSKSKIEEVPKILLAYPRDCPLFMETMAEFRKILTEYNKAEVYDVWDTDIWEQVAEKKESWALKYCYDPNVKVILMATHCSIVIQDALINGKEIEYLDPESFDNVFLIILKCVMEISVNEALYTRVFVVRLDGTDCEEHTFKYICPFTVYTIPQQLHALSLFIKNCDYCEIDNSVTVTGLSSSIEKLNKFKTENPDYINNLIRTKLNSEQI